MSANVINQVAFLRTSREFPKEDVEQLSVELSKSYIDIANVVNARTIGIFTSNKPSITGESWFFTSRKQQSLRQVFTFTTITAINHGIDLTKIDRFLPSFGEYTDGVNWYGLINANNLGIANQLTFYVTPTQIVFTNTGAPALTLGTIVLNWLSRP